MIHTRNRKQFKNRGFTLVEMIVTMVVLSIMLALTVSGLSSWQTWANFNRENEYAQTLFLAAQNQLVEFAADGRLKELQDDFDAGPDILGASTRQYTRVGFNITDSMSLIKDNQGNAYNLATIFPESMNESGQVKTDAALYQGEIVSLRAEAGDYAEYLDDSIALKEKDPEAYWLFELLGSYVYDPTILNGTKTSSGEMAGAAICVELTPADGQVFSVLYSDRNRKFVYQGVPGDKKSEAVSGGVADIADRNEMLRMDNMVGYYGVDTLSMATKNEVITPGIASVKLYNKDTFYMTYRLSAQYKQVLTSQLTYIMDLHPTKNVDDKLLTLTLDGTKLKNADHATTISCPVSTYDEEGNEVKLGEFPVYAWVEPNYSVHVMLDAADIQATTDLYERELDDIRAVDKAAGTDFAKTYSFFRFGVMADELYASVTAKGDKFGTAPTVSNFGNLNILKNQQGKNPVFGGASSSDVAGTDGKKDFRYSIVNARHLYNIRYIEDLSYEKEAGSVDAAEKINGVTFEVKSDIDWAEFEGKGELYNSFGAIDLTSLNDNLYDVEGNAIDKVSVENCSFPSISQLRARDSVKGNGKTISGLGLSEISNALYGIYIKPGKTEMFDDKPVGFINVNYGHIEDLKLDKVVATGSNLVGGFCGINAGEVKELTLLNTDKESKISGRKNVGGIIGFQMAAKEDTVIETLKNYASVEGVEAVGGIMGMMRNTYDMITLSDLTGLSQEAYNQLNNKTIYKFTVRKCENYGAVTGVGSSDLKGVFSAGTAPTVTRPAETEARYIGGIVGYSYNCEKDKADNIVLEECTSSPQFDDVSLSSILADDNAVKDKLKGVYVGGIVGYNYFGDIHNCMTKSKGSKEGYIFGYRYVGGIVGFNIGPASGIVGTNGTKQGENNNHIIADSYAGGIVGCNALAKDKDSEGKDIAEAEGDPEKLEGLLLPDRTRNLNVKTDNWVNRGVVIAVSEYSGGITGYNTGFIYRCNSKVESGKANKYFDQLLPGDYAGGITGYNNGVIGNSEREITDGGAKSTVTAKGKELSTVCYVKGRNYVGGVVGYNDVDSIVEDYEITGGYVHGNTEGYYAGGYAGFNSSIYLLQDEKGTPRYIKSNPNTVQGGYFVGGCIGGNMLNTKDNKLIQPDKEVTTNPEDAAFTTDEEKASVYAEFVGQIQASGDKYIFYGNLKVYNKTSNPISAWSVTLDDCKGLTLTEGTGQVRFEKDTNTLLWRDEWNGYRIDAGGKYEPYVKFSADSRQELEKLQNQTWAVRYFEEHTNVSSTYVGAQEDSSKCDVSLTITDVSDNDWYRAAKFNVYISNKTGNPLTNLRVEVTVPDGVTLGFESKHARIGDVESIYCDSKNGVIGPYATALICFRAEFASKEVMDEFLKMEPSVYFNNVMYYAGTNPGVSTEPGVEIPKKIYTRFKTDNFLGTLRGKEFVGGFIGYNMVFEKDKLAWDEDRGAVYYLQNKLKDNIKNETDSKDEETALRNAMQVVDNLADYIGEEIPSAPVQFVISGEGAETTRNAFGKIEADLFAGGVIGYNDADTMMYVKNVENATEVVVKYAITNQDEQYRVDDTGKKVYRTTDYKGAKKEFTYSYAGGITGKVSKKTTLDHCWNAATGEVRSKGTYTGGLCEINEGMVTNCEISNFGDSVTDYIGGLCGLNKSSGNISKCNATNRTISGQNLVGAIACENFGTISNINVSKVRMLVEGNKDADKHGVAGIYAAYNAGTIVVLEDLKDVNITSGGRYVGGVVGINEGNTQNRATPSEGNLGGNVVITGSVTGYYDVGGFIGKNQDKNQENVVTGYTNKATVTATHGGAGGIIGVNASDNTIQYCVNEGHVAATDAGNAGGIVSSNSNLIEHCYDYKTVIATKGLCGGITAENEKGGIIRDCHVEPTAGEDNIAFTSTKTVGAITATNAGLIEKNYLKNVTVQNDTSTMTSNIGVIAGENLSTGEIKLYGGGQGKVENCKVLVRSNYSKAGGVTGTNAGTIDAPNKDAVVGCEIQMYEASIANIGGVTGINTGTITNVSVDADIEGKLGAATAGYGGIAGYNGFVSKTEAERLGEGKENGVTARITGCSFDGTLKAPGAAGATARIGGITGINGYGTEINDCGIGVRTNNIAGVWADKTSITSGDITKQYTDPDKNAHAYIGGVTGENYGRIMDVDMEAKTTDTVEIISFAGDAGAIAGSTYVGSRIGGSGKELVAAGEEPKYLTTSSKISVDMRAGENDHGAGGLAGYNRSGYPVRYVKNYANVTNLYSTNIKVSGIYGSCEVQDAPSLVFEHVYNYGRIWGGRDAGGFVGRLKFTPVSLKNCYNYGEIFAARHFSGGFIGALNEVSDNCYFTNCENHGRIYSNKNSGYPNASGGLIGGVASIVGTPIFRFYNCVNTGIIEGRDTDGIQLISTSNTGDFVGTGSSAKMYLELCRNYNTNSLTNGFVGAGGNVNLKNCLDNSGIAVSGSKPFGGSLNTTQNVYYLKNSIGAKLLDCETENAYDTYFVLSRGSSNGDLSLNDVKFTALKRPNLFLGAPNTGMKIKQTNKTATLEFGLSQGDSAPGMKEFNVYLWNGSTAEGSAAIQYSCEAEFMDVDGAVQTVAKTASGAYDLESSKVTFEVPAAIDSKKIKTIRFTLTNQSGGNVVYMRGFTWTPVGGAKETVCTYLSEKYGTAFSIEAIHSGSAMITYMSTSTGGKHVSGRDNYNDDLLNGEWVEYQRMYFARASASSTGRITFAVHNGTKATGVGSFVVYFANDSTKPVEKPDQIRTYTYQYRVAFVDGTGNKTYATHTDASGNETDIFETKGYDSSIATFKQDSRCEIPNPNPNKIINQIILEVFSATYTTTANNGTVSAPKTDNTVSLRDFAWIPEGSLREEKMVCFDDSDTAKDFYPNNADKVFSPLYMDYEAKGTSEAPYVYLEKQSNLGFKMDANDPVRDRYYADKEYYVSSEASGNHSRIQVYKDIDPKFVALMEQEYVKLYKLNAPTGLNVKTVNGMYEFSWGNVSKAYQYELYYVLRDQNNQEILSSEPELIGTLDRTYRVPIEEEWSDNHYQIEFRIRAINAYRYLPDGDDSKDSDWASSEGIEVKKVLAKPEFHIEVTPDNKIMAVLDNRDDYMDASGNYLDCTVDIVYDSTGKKYAFHIPVMDSRFSTERHTNTSGKNNDLTWISSTKPNSSILDSYEESENNIKAGRMITNEDLMTRDRFAKSTKFAGFSGSVPEDMTFTVCFTADNHDGYIITDLSAYDETIGTEISYTSENSHVASYGSTVNATTKLSNIPTEWFGEACQNDIMARVYPYQSQYFMVHYGHTVAEDIDLNGQTPEENKAILAGYPDPYYLNADGIQQDVSILDDTGNLKDGYVIYKKYREDGSTYYNIEYNATLAMSKQNARKYNSENPTVKPIEYYKYAVDYLYLTRTDNMVNTVDYQDSYYAKDMNQGTHKTEKLDSNETKYIQELQPAPIMDGDIQTGTNPSTGKTTYTISWDTYFRNRECWNQGKDPSTQASTIDGYLWYQSNNANYVFKEADKEVAKTWEVFADKAGYYNITDNTKKRQIMNAYYFTYMNNANYLVEMVGTTQDGREVVLKSQRITEQIPVTDEDTAKTYTYTANKKSTEYPKYEKWTHKATFEAESNWEYPLLTIRVTRESDLYSITRGYNNNNTLLNIACRAGRTDLDNAVYNFRLPRYATKDISVKLKLGTISKPAVQLASKDGEYVTNTLAYNVEWNALLKEAQVHDLGGYLITVTQKTPVDAAKLVKPHYYYVKDIGNPEATTADIGLNVAALEANGVVTRIAEDNYVKDGEKRSTVIDLSDFNTGDVVTVSIKAIASTEALYYGDGDEGVETEFPIPKRLPVPDVNKLSVVTEGEDGGMPTFDDATTVKKNTSEADVTLVNTVNMETYKKGLAMRYAITEDAADLTNYIDETSAKLVMAVAVYNEMPAGLDTDKTTVSGVDAADAVSGAASWNDGAYKTIYTKAEPVNLDNASAMNIQTIDFTEYEQYPGEFAGKWLKVALKATSNSMIDSQWSDQDVEGETLNYKWIHIPRLLMDDVDLKEMDNEAEEEGKQDVTRYYYENDKGELGLYDEDKQGPGSVAVRTKTLTFSEDRAAGSYDIYLVGQTKTVTEQVDGVDVTKEVTPTYHIELKRHLKDENDPATQDGTWDVFWNEGEEPIGNIGVSYDKSVENLILNLEELVNWEVIVDRYPSCKIMGQLRYVADEKGATFLLVLPDLTVIDENSCEKEEEKFFIMEALVSKKAEAGATAYTEGNRALFKRTSKEEDGVTVWSTKIEKADVTDAIKWYDEKIKPKTSP